MHSQGMATERADNHATHGWPGGARIRHPAVQATATMEHPVDTDEVLAATVNWVERAVLGLELCPFARQPLRQQRVCFRVSDATDPGQLLDDLRDELLGLHAAPATGRETTLLIHPRIFAGSEEFDDFNEFLGRAEQLIEELRLEGELQVASFHPGYRFADVAPGDPANYSNRSPYPVLHLLREDSIEKGVAAFGDADAIWRRNMQRLRALGHAGWQRLWTEPDS